VGDPGRVGGEGSPELADVWFTATRVSPRRSVAVRSDSGFGLATNSAEPFPVPLVRVPRSQVAVVEACHVHPDVPVTPTVKVPPAAGTSTDSTFGAIRHGAGSCWTAILVPFTEIEAARLTPMAFSATITATAVSPWPVCGVI